MRHKNRTANGDRLREAAQARYERWWLGKTVVEPLGTMNGIEAEGKIAKVKYIGNSVYGIVKLTFENGCEYFVHTTSFRPRKSDLKVVE